MDIEYGVSGTRYSFILGPYDRTKELMIDPLLASTFLGGLGSDACFDVEIDRMNRVYVCGTAIADGFPATGICISVFSSDLTELKYSTVLKNKSWLARNLFDMTFGGTGSIYLFGLAQSNDFPVTPGAYCTGFVSPGRYFLCRFDVTLSTLPASTFFGPDPFYTNSCGSSYLNKASLSVDDDGYVFAGSKTCTDYDVSPDAFDNTAEGETEIFIDKFTPDLSERIASILLGGEDMDFLHTLKIGPRDQLVAVGTTFSPDFPVTPTAYDTLPGNVQTGLRVEPDGFAIFIDKNLSTGVVPVEMSLNGGRLYKRDRRTEVENIKRDRKSGF